MQLPEYFSFTQQNLQDYLDCPRRFYLRHIIKQEWPAIESEPIREQEALIALGERFHRMVQQLFAGIPQQTIEATLSEPELLEWWHQFIHLNIDSQSGTKLCERMLTIPFAGYRLAAKYDLLVYLPEKQAAIYDWKTSQHLPKRAWLSARMQTRVYPFLLAALSAQSNSEFKLTPDQIEMIYWYPAFPDSAVQFAYSNSQFLEDEKYLLAMIQEIEHLNESGFTKTENERLCSYCRYRSLCNRGISAGNRHDSDDLQTDDESAFDIDFDQILPAE